jgi:hypothetical protein
MTPQWAPFSATSPTSGTSPDAARIVPTIHRSRFARRWLPSSPLPGDEPYPPAQPVAVCALIPRAESVRTGREFTRAALSGWRMTDLTDVAELVVSELVTNAVRHGMPSAWDRRGDCAVRIRLLAQDPFLMCMVSDPGTDIPVLRESDPSAECGRGLQVVESCCVRWGWHLLDEGGKVVWALLRQPT